MKNGQTHGHTVLLRISECSLDALEKDTFKKTEAWKQGY